MAYNTCAIHLDQGEDGVGAIGLVAGHISLVRNRREAPPLSWLGGQTKASSSSVRISCGSRLSDPVAVGTKYSPISAGISRQ